MKAIHRIVYVIVLLSLLACMVPFSAAKAEAGTAYVIVHALNPEGVEIASISGVGTQDVKIYDGDTLIGYGAYNQSTHNKKMAVSAGSHTIRAEFNGMSKERLVALEPNETENIVFTFERTEFDIVSWLSGGYQERMEHSWTGLSPVVYVYGQVSNATFLEYWCPRDMPGFTVNASALLDMSFKNGATDLLARYDFTVEGAGSPYDYPYIEVASIFYSQQFPILSSGFPQDSSFDYWYFQRPEGPFQSQVTMEYSGRQSIALTAEVQKLPSNTSIATFERALVNVRTCAASIWGTGFKPGNYTGEYQLHEIYHEVDKPQHCSSVPYDMRGTGIKDGQPPVASFTYSPEKPVVSQEVKFDASASYDPDADDSIVAHSWDFGDGESAANEVVSHTYAKPGNYTATLTVKDEVGNENSSSQDITVNPLPVLLVHGYKGTPCELDPMKTWLENDVRGRLGDGEGFIADLVDYTGGQVANGDIKTYAGRLADRVESIKRTTGAPQVDIIAHSMGGLVSRWYIEKGGGAGNVRKLIMLGTPNHGSELFDIRNIPILGKVISWLQKPGKAGEQMTPNSSFLKELGYEGRSNYYTIAGTNHQLDPATSWLTNLFLWGPDDGLVRVSSVRLNAASNQPSWPLTHAQLETDGSLYDQVISKILYGEPPGFTNYSGFTAQQDEGYLQETPAISGTLLPGQQESRAIPISATSQANFALVWESGDLDLTLTTPSGSLIDPSTAQTDPNVSYYGEGNVTAEGYTVQNPEPGTWLVNITAATVPEEGAPYTVRTFLETTLTLTLNMTEYEYDPGDIVLVVAGLGNGTTPVTSASVTATIQRPDESIETLVMYDDGLHNDNGADDGVYGNAYLNTLDSGAYQICVSAFGTIDSEEFAREASATIWVEQYPDLTLTSSDIELSKVLALVGDNVTISATVHNVGDAEAGNASILFYDGEPTSGTLIGEDTITVSAGGTAEASVSWTVEQAGSHEVYVVVSPYNSFLEQDYSNNIASSGPIQVRGIASCDSEGNATEQFAAGETVYVKGIGLEPNTTYTIWIQDDPVADGDALIPDEDPSAGQEMVTTDASGDFTPQAIWAIAPSTAAGEYDIVADSQDLGTIGNYDSPDYIDAPGREGFTVMQAPLRVATCAASAKASTWATLNGNLASLGNASSVQVSFEWGLTTAYGNETTPQTMTGPGVFSFAVNGLSIATTYHYRARAVGDGTAYGNDLTFTTSFLPPTVATDDPSSVTAHSATLNGTLSDLGAASSVLVFFQWGLTTAYGSTTALQNMTDTGVFSASLNGLTLGTTYHFRAKAVGDGTAYGVDRVFTTSPAILPTVITIDATGIGNTTATLNGDLANLGTALSAQVSFQWGLTASYDSVTPWQDVTDTAAFSSSISGLSPRTTYHFRTRALGDGAAYGSDVTFTTQAAPLAVTTRSATVIGTTSASLNGDLTSRGTDSSADVSFEWGLTTSYGDTTTPQTMTGTGLFSFALSGLTPSTTYHFRARALGDGTAYGSDMTFTTGTSSLTVTTNPADNVTPTSATLNGYLDSLPLKLDFVAVSGADYHPLGVRSNGTLWAWGYNYYGQLGLGDTTDRWVPTQVGSATNWVAVAGGYFHSLGVRSDGTLWAWGGSNSAGQLGLGDTTSRTSPTQVGSATNWVAVAATYNHSLGLRSDGTLWAWGDNYYGQLGLGDTTNRLSPTQVGTANDWVAVATGTRHTLGLRSDGTLWAWGTNGNYQLGLGDTTTRLSPAQLGNATNWAAVAAGSVHSLGVRSDGTLWAWGDNSFGQLGLGDTTQRKSPTQVGTATSWVAVAAGSSSHSLGVRSDGTLWSWGYNSYGQLGLGDTTSRTSPTQVGAATNWVVAAGGYYHSLGVRSDGTLWSWGRNDKGQLGLGDTTQRNNPTQVGLPSCQVWFEWGLTAAYGNSTPTQNVSGTDPFNGPISGLGPGTTYHFRACAANGGTISYGEDMTFTTTTTPPTVTTSPATGVTPTSATLNGNLTSLGTATPVNVSFVWGTALGGPYANETAATPPTMTATGTFSASLSGILLPGTTYYFKAKANGGASGTNYGDEGNFTTLSGEIQIPLKAGWNMVSVPLTLDNNSVSMVFPDAAAVYTWDPTSRTYMQPVSVEPQKGYWVAVVADKTITLTGTPVSTWTTDIKAGWNMIGSVIDAASIATPNDDPDGSVQPFACWWDPINKTYINTTNIEPGKGYWVASLEDCTLTVP